ncbi:MAG TPA: hypothetical protein VLH56_08975, partial [Dissulfurispiraceae bacterium]|nr:hypothetical protein [Dissulfurispiraceae bacterium]
AVRKKNAGSTFGATGRVDQQTSAGPGERGESTLNANERCLKIIDTFRFARSIRIVRRLYLHAERIVTRSTVQLIIRRVRRRRLSISYQMPGTRR